MRDVLFQEFFEGFSTAAKKADRLPSYRDNIDGPRRRYVYRRERPHVFRVRMSTPLRGEDFFLRVLLRHRAATSFTDLRTVDGVLLDTFEAACRALGYIEGDDGGVHAMQEAFDLGYTPGRLIALFVVLFLNGAPPSRMLEVVTPPLGVRDRGILAELENRPARAGDSAAAVARAAAKVRLLAEIRRRFRAAGVPDRAGIDQLRSDGFGGYFDLDAAPAIDEQSIVVDARAHLVANQSG